MLFSGCFDSKPGTFSALLYFPASRCLHKAIQASYVVFATGSELILQFIAVECSVGSPAAALCQSGKRSRPRTARVVRVNHPLRRSPARPAVARGRTGGNPPVMGDKQPSRLTCSVTGQIGASHNDDNGIGGYPPS